MRPSEVLFDLSPSDQPRMNATGRNPVGCGTGHQNLETGDKRGTRILRAKRSSSYNSCSSKIDEV